MSLQPSPTTIRLEPEIYAEVSELARKNRRSIPAEINYLLEIAITTIKGGPQTTTETNKEVNP